LQQLSYNYLSKVEDYKLIDNFNIKEDIIIVVIKFFLLLVELVIIKRNDLKAK